MTAVAGGSAESGGRRWLVSERVPGSRAYIPPSFGADRFRVRGDLANGGQGYTLLGEDTWSGGAVVIKGTWWRQRELDEPRRARAALARRNDDLRRGFAALRRVVQLTQQAPAVIDVITEPSPSLVEVGVAEPPLEIFVVQQFVGYGGRPAHTLAHEIGERRRSNRPFRETELLDLADQLCATLAALHVPRDRGAGRKSYWIHADVKPENVLVLGPPPRYVLIDYDAAAESGQEVGFSTPAYAPPGPVDRLPERDRADHRFDLYMLGTTLAEAAALQRLDEETRRQLYSDNPAEANRPRQDLQRKLTGAGYDAILASIIVSCLAGPRGRIKSVQTAQVELAGARDAAALRRALARGER